MLRLATAVSTWPFYNFRYRKLLYEPAKRFHLYVFAGSVLPGDEKYNVLKPLRVIPLKLPRRIWYYISPLFAKAALNVVNAEVEWLFRTATSMFFYQNINRRDAA